MTKKKLTFEVFTPTKSEVNVEKAELLLKSAKEWLTQHKGERAQQSFKEVSEFLGVKFSNAHNLSWVFSPHNKRSPVRELAVKYGVYVGRHNGLDKKPENQSITFRDMRITDIPEDEKELRRKLSG